MLAQIGSTQIRHCSETTRGNELQHARRGRAVPVYGGETAYFIRDADDTSAESTPQICVGPSNSVKTGHGFARMNADGVGMIRGIRVPKCD
jgi:hypothetical protein